MNASSVTIFTINELYTTARIYGQSQQYPCSPCVAWAVSLPFHSSQSIRTSIFSDVVIFFVKRSVFLDSIDHRFCRDIIIIITINFVLRGWHITVKRLTNPWPSNSRSNWNLEMLIFVEGGKPENPEKNPRSKDENRQQTQPAYGTRSRIRTPATLEEGERDHHCAIPAPH